jgi:hypothetical protein
LGLLVCWGVLAAVAVVAADHKAGAAVDGATLRRIKRDGRLLAALSTLDCDFDALAHARSLRGGDGCEPFVLRLLARLATLRLVSQALVVKKELLASRPDEFLPAVNADYGAILELYFHLIPLSVGRRRYLRCLNL